MSNSSYPLTEQEEIILFFSEALIKHSGRSFEKLQETYINTTIGITYMTPVEKRSLVDERIEMMKNLRSLDGEDAADEN